MFPLILNLTGRLAVVVGGGAVGRRKAHALLDAGARARVVCPGPRPDGEDERLEWVAEAYRPEHLVGAALVFAAATPEVNARVVTDSRSAGIWVNSADDPERGDFFVPATVRRGDMLIAVSTGGAAPALARRVRERLEEQFDDHFAAWVELLGEMRPVVLARVPDAERRRALFERLSDWSWLERLRTEGRDAVRAAMRALVDAAAGE